MRSSALAAPSARHDGPMTLEQLGEELDAVSALYAQRNGITRTDEWLVLKINEEVGELTQAFLARSGQTRDRGKSQDDLDADLRSELADSLAHILLLAHRLGVDMTASDSTANMPSAPATAPPSRPAADWREEGEGDRTSGRRARTCSFEYFVSVGW